MRNLYSITKNQDAIRCLCKVQRDSVGKLPQMPKGRDAKNQMLLMDEDNVTLKLADAR